MSAAPQLAPDVAKSPSVTRLLSPGVEAALEQFSNPEVLAAGKVNLIALDAIKARFGERWPMRREPVYEHVQGVLDRQLGIGSYHLRISDTDVLVCQPELSRLAGQAACLRLLRDILSHFLGPAELGEVAVHEVLRVSSAGVEAQPIDPHAALVAEAEAGGKASAGLASPTNALLGPAAVWTPFVASNGRQAEVTCALDSVIELRGSTKIALRFRRCVLDAASKREFSPTDLARLSRSDRLRIDLGNIALGLEDLRRQQRANKPPALILSVSFSSLSNIDDRARIVSAFQEARGYASKGVICALLDIEGVPAATLQAAAATIAPFSLFVIGHVSELTRPEARVLKDAGLRGVSIDCPPSLDDAAFLGWTKSTVMLAKHAARSVLVYRLGSVRRAMIAAAVGATHAHVVD